MIKSLILLLVFSLELSAQLKEGLGEKSFDQYIGPHTPEFRVVRSDGSFILKDDQFRDEFPIQLISEDFLYLKRFTLEYILPKFTCHPRIYEENYDYMAFLFRLVAISKKYKALKKVHLSLYQVGEKENKCKLDYSSIFGQCRPRSKEMKKFLSRVDNYFPDLIDWGKYPIFLKNKSTSKLLRYHGDEFERVLSSGHDLESQLVNSCQKLKKSINSLCSEQDKLFGMSFDLANQRYVKESAPFRTLDSKGRGEECLAQFVSLNAKKEQVSNYNQFILSNTLERDDEIFYYGSLKEFDEQGVTLIEKAEVSKEVVVAKKEVKMPKPIVVAKIENPKKVVRPKVVKIKERSNVIKIKLTALKEAVTRHLKTGISIDVDLVKMRTDYTYSKSLLSKLNGSLRPYQTRKALTEMRKYDNLGSIQTPLSFLFLRYLLDFELHQGLFNLTGVLGDEFYIINDIEKEKKPIKIRLLNTRETNNRWKMSVVEASL